jgi:hypothetical protein
MRKRVASATLAGLLGATAVAGEAAAVPTVELIWQASGTPSHALLPGERGSLEVILVNDMALVAATLMLGLLDAGGSSPRIVAAANTPPAPLGSVPFSTAPLPPDGIRVGSYGGLTLGELGPGTYTLGTVTIAAGSETGDFGIDLYQRWGIDDWLDSGMNIVSPALHGATLQVIPEPATVSLVGLGFAILAARRRKAH